MIEAGKKQHFACCLQTGILGATFQYAAEPRPRVVPSFIASDMGGQPWQDQPDIT
jgi:hypothetical protein